MIRRGSALFAIVSLLECLSPVDGRETPAPAHPTIKVVINPEARVGATLTGATGTTQACGTDIPIPVEIINQAGVTARLKAELVENVPSNVRLEFRPQLLHGLHEEMRVLHIVLNSPGLVDLTIAFRAQYASPDADGDNRVHFLMQCSSAHQDVETSALVSEAGIVHVPSFDLPLSAYMSEQAKRAFIKDTAAAQLPDTDWKSLPISKIRASDNSVLQKYLDHARALYPVNVDERRIGGVPTRVVTPKSGVTAANRHRVLINLHGGGFFEGADNQALLESVPLAGLGKLEVVTVDYREGPEYRFPAASEDVASVYAALLREYKPGNIGIYGCSAGGILTTMAVAWFQKHQLPVPGAIGIFGSGAFGAWYGPPSKPGTWSGDSAYTGPRSVGDKTGPLDPKKLPAYMSAYLANANLTDPLVSPALSPSVLRKFPPTLLITGTRSFDMSAAVQTQRALTKAGVEADLHLWDGVGHCFFFDADLPESQEAFAVMTRFFDSRLGN